MKASTKSLWLAGALLAWGAETGAAPFTYETEAEFQLSADLDGDGVDDAVIVDRATGLVRVGYTSPGSGTLNSADLVSWVEARDSGVENVESVSAGVFGASGPSSLALAGRSANRINILSLPATSATPIPQPAFVPGVGPNLVIAADIGGTGNTTGADLIVGTAENGPPSAQRLAFVRRSGGSFSDLFEAPLNGPVHAGNVVSLNKLGTADMPAWMAEGPAFDALVVINASSGTNLPFLNVRVAAGSRYIHGPFGTNTYSQFLVWVPGDTRLFVEPVVQIAGRYEFGRETAYSLDTDIETVFPLGGPTPSQLLAIVRGGTQARIYGYDGSGAPVLLQTIPAAPGERFTGAWPRGGFFDLYRGGVEGRSARLDHYRSVHGGAVKTGSDNLPPVSAARAVANLFLFHAEPFVSRTPGLVQTLRAPDWSRSAALSGAPQSLIVTRELYSAGTTGLNHPTDQSIAGVNTNASFAMPNQIRPDISVASFEIAAGDEIVDVRIDPPGGVFDNPVVARFQASPNTATIYYRIGATNGWHFASPSLAINSTSSVEFYARLLGAGDRKSRIHTANFVISKIAHPPVPLGITDLNGNLLSDDWEHLFLGHEVGNALSDSFGNGVSDLQSFLFGHDPSNPASVPPVKVDLTPPSILLSSADANGLHLEFSYPAGYTSQFQFTLMAASSPSGPFSPASAPLVPDADNVFRTTIQPGRSATGFYIVSQELR
ncbi:MAG TPA: hypothetical protein VMF06_13955 [Candidatus Limnocylindria bacterium]|jgi:hypothetical protein|nr:hypothetical protein [Candidatus Limnocylindria bacterium]